GERPAVHRVPPSIHLGHTGIDRSMLLDGEQACECPPHLFVHLRASKSCRLGGEGTSSAGTRGVVHRMAGGVPGGPVAPFSFRGAKLKANSYTFSFASSLRSRFSSR